MGIDKKSKKNPQSEIRNPKSLGRCFFRATPLLPGHKLAYWQKRTRGKGGGGMDH
jgi:hypothetical protein